MSYDAATKGGWTPEEAEMPSDGVVTPLPHDGLYYCPDERCEQLKGFALKCELRKHNRTHTLPVKCVKCSYAAAEQRDVDRHIRVAHRGLAEELWGPMKLFACTACEKKFRRSDYVQKHYKAQHIQ